MNEQKVSLAENASGTVSVLRETAFGSLQTRKLLIFSEFNRELGIIHSVGLTKCLGKIRPNLTSRAFCWQTYRGKMLRLVLYGETQVIWVPQRASISYAKYIWLALALKTGRILQAV